MKHFGVINFVVIPYFIYVVFPTLVDACLADLVASEGKFHVHNNLFFDPSKDKMAEK